VGRAGLVGALIALALPVGAVAQDVARDFDNPGSNDPSQQLDGGTPPVPANPHNYPNVQRDDTPNDPGYDRAEPDDPDGGTSTNLFEERFDLFGFASERTRDEAKYLDPNGDNFGSSQVSGFNAAGGWKRTTGDPEVAVAVLDTGIDWGNSGVRTQVALNRDELPLPQDATGDESAEYDRNGDQAFNVDDYAVDPRVDDSAPTGQDLIRAFSDGHDGLGGPTEDNGYVDDIAGWDFFDDDNDPSDTSSYFAAGGHGTGRMNEAAERGNDGLGELGVCPKCQVMPVRIWDTFVSDQNSFFMGVVYATDNGAEVIAGADGGLYHSAFAEQASQYAYDHGVAQTFSGNDLNTGNHNYPAAYDHAMLIEGVVGDTEGLGTDIPDPGGEDDPGIRDAIIGVLQALPFIGTMANQSTYFRSANTAQFGGKSSISMQGPTGSTNTGKAAGAAALVISAAREDADIDDLSPDELRALLEQTAEDVLPGDTGPPPIGVGVPDPAQEGFDTHFGYGRANLGEAVRHASEGRIPPEASIASPDWYAPVVGDSVPVTGLADARESVNGGDFSWRLEYGIGLAPTSWTEVSAGASEGEPVTDFGNVDLAAVRAELADRSTFPDRDDPAGPLLDKAPGLDPFQGQFSLRLVVTSEGGEEVPSGEDRQVLTAVPDGQELREGFPKRLGTGGEGPLRYANINGDNRQELIVPAQDGQVHAYRPDGSELPGWPVRTETQFAARAHLGSPALQELEPPLEPPRAPTIADLTGDGIPEVITAAGERIYVWNSGGDLLPGWPVRPDPERRNCALSEQQREDDLKHPKCGFIASPSVARLAGRGEPLSIVVPGLDGRLRAYQPDGTATSGFPVRLIDPDLPSNEQMTAESINNPAIGDMNGDGREEIVIASNETYGGESGGGDVSFGGLLSAAGQTARVYAVKAEGRGPDGNGDPFMSGWPVKPGGIIQNVLPLVGPGHDAAFVKVGGEQQVVVSVTSGPLTLYDVNGEDGTPREITQTPAGLNLFESAAVGDIDGLTGPDVVKYQVDAAQAANLLLVGQNEPYSHRIGAYTAADGAPTGPGFPVVTDDYQFLSSSTVAKVADGSSNQVLTGTGLGLLHAYDGVTGRDTGGFPKVTGGWLFAPAAVSDDKRIAAITREGFLFEWDAPQAPACQSEWPSFRHDQQGTGNYDADGTPPAAPENVSLELRGGNTFRLSFKSPGDDGFCGTAARYVADAGGDEFDLGEPVEGGKTVTRDLDLQPGARVTIRAEDEAPNLGPPGFVARAAQGDGSAGPGDPTPGGDTGVRRRSLPCIPRRARVTAGRVGPARIGRSLTALQRRYRVTRRSRGTVRFCVRGGGRFLVRARKGRIDLVATTARAHRTRQAAPGRRPRRGRIRGAQRLRRGVLVGALRRQGRVVYGTRAGRVRFLAVVSRSQARRPAALARRLRSLGLR